MNGIFLTIFVQVIHFDLHIFLSMAGLLFSFDIYPRGVYNINMIKSFADKETEKVTNDN